jgi:2-hydroxy-4-carboxymuconate semialdehyde hemiacetal dehydrogenase
MVGHTRRFNPSHQYIHNKITAGELNIQQMDVQTYFFRRKNMNAKGEARSWTDHLLWHHAAHTVDLFAYQAGPIVKANAVEGPDPSRARHRDGHVDPAEERERRDLHAACRFNNDGPLGTFFRYIGDNGTWLARYDDLFTGKEERSTWPASPSRTTASNCRTASSSPRSAKGASPTARLARSSIVIGFSENWRRSSRQTPDPI